MTEGLREPGRNAWQLLRDRTFGPFMVGKVLASCGIWVHNITAAVLMYELTGSAFMVGMVSALQFAGPVLLSLWAGALSDRRDRRKLLMLAHVFSAGAMGWLAILVAVRGVAGFGTPAPLLAGVLVMGVGLALAAPAMQALVPALVRDGELQMALALSSAAPSIARTVGPAVGAGLLVLGGPGAGFAVGASTHVTFLLVLAAIRAHPTPRPDQPPRLLGGLRYLVSDRNAGLLMLGVASLAIGSDPIVTLAPAFAEQLGGGSGLVGVLAASFGGGAVLVIFLMPRLQRLSLRRIGIAGFWVLSSGLCIAAAVPAAPLAATGFGIAGAGFMMAAVGLTTRIQRRVPDGLRGRVMALWGVAWLGTRPFAALFNGLVADLASVRLAVVVAALCMLAASLLARVSYATPMEP